MHSHTCCIYFQMYLQNICTGSCKVTQVAFSWLFPTVPFKVSPQIAYLSGCKVTLVAFVWLFLHCAFSDVSWEYLHGKMHSHAGCTFFTFSPLCVFECLFKLPACEDAKSHWLHLIEFSPVCVFKCVLKWHAWEDAKSHWLHLIEFSPVCVFKCVLKWHAWEDAQSHWLHFFDTSPMWVFKCVFKMLE